MSTIIRHRTEPFSGDPDSSTITLVVTDYTHITGFRALYQRYRVHPNGYTSMLHSEEWSDEKGAIAVFNNPNWEFPNHPNNVKGLLAIEDFEDYNGEES